MAFWDWFSRERLQIIIVVALTLGFHIYSIRKRMYEESEVTTATIGQDDKLENNEDENILTE